VVGDEVAGVGELIGLDLEDLGDQDAQFVEVLGGGGGVLGRRGAFL